MKMNYITTINIHFAYVRVCKIEFDTVNFRVQERLLMPLPRHKCTKCIQNAYTLYRMCARICFYAQNEIYQQPLAQKIKIDDALLHCISKWVLSIEDLFQVSKSIKFATHTVMNDGNGRWQPHTNDTISNCCMCVNAFTIALEPERKKIYTLTHNNSSSSSSKKNAEKNYNE